jgi:PAS domain S-box-containing protein
MTNLQIEIILSRQLADSLSMPVFLVDTQGNLLFFNEPAEEILGARYEETGFMPVEKWASVFKPQDKDGNILPPENLPLVKTLASQKPHYGEFWINRLKDGELYKISVTSFPIIGRPDRFVGAMALFWKSPDS